MRIDLNADVGESFGAYTYGHDAALIPSITSANIAAGFHGGDPSVLRATVRLANAHGVAIGAHPGFADLAGFGRRAIQMAAGQIEDLVLYQIAAVAGVAAAEGARLAHVKPHGALYNIASHDRPAAEAIVRAIAAFDASLAVFALPGSAMALAARDAGLRVAVEAFVDRAYGADGRLAPRGTPNAVISDWNVAAARAVRIVTERTVIALDGTVLPVEADTICIHSDTPGADRGAAAVRAALDAAGVEVKAIGSSQHVV